MKGERTNGPHIVFSSIVAAYRPMAGRIYIELLQIPDIGCKLIAHTIAQYAASVEASCTGCSDFKVIVNEDSSDWVPAMSLWTPYSPELHAQAFLDCRMIPSVVHVMTDHHYYCITNMHARNDEGYNVLCGDCLLNEHPRRRSLGFRCNRGTYQVNCDNCTGSYCDKCLVTCTEYKIPKGTRLTSPTSDVAYVAFCVDCSTSNPTDVI